MSIEPKGRGGIGLPFLRRALGRPLTAEEVEGWLLANPARRATVVARVKALRARMRIPSPTPTQRARLAASAGVSEGAFANLFRRWRAERRLTGLGLGIVPRVGEVRKKSDVLEARTVITGILKTAAPSSDEHVVTEAIGMGGAPSRLGRSTLRAIVRGCRAADGGPFGGELIFDESILALRSPDGGRWRAMLVLDRGTSIVCGFALTVGPASMEVVKAAAADAAARLVHTRLPGVVPASGPPVFTIPSSGDAMEMLRFISKRRGWDVAAGPARSRAAMTLLQGAIGRLRLAPGPDRGRTADGADVDMPVLLRDEAERLLILLVERHNRERLEDRDLEDPAVLDRRLLLAAKLAPPA